MSRGNIASSLMEGTKCLNRGFLPEGRECMPSHRTGTDARNPISCKTGSTSANRYEKKPSQTGNQWDVPFESTSETKQH